MRHRALAVALSAKHTRFTLTQGGVRRNAHMLTSLAVTFDGMWRRAVAFRGGGFVARCRQFLIIQAGAPLGGVEGACTDSTSIRFEGVFVSPVDSGRGDATAAQLEGAPSPSLVAEDSFKTSLCLHRRLLSVHTHC